MGKLDYNALTSEQKERLQSFFAATFTLGEKELEAIDDMTPMPEGWHDLTPEEVQVLWEKLCTRIRETYGPDTI